MIYCAMGLGRRQQMGSAKLVMGTMVVEGVRDTPSRLPHPGQEGRISPGARPVNHVETVGAKGVATVVKSPHLRSPAPGFPSQLTAHAQRTQPGGAPTLRCVSTSGDELDRAGAVSDVHH